MKKKILFFWTPSFFAASLAYYYFFIVSKRPKVYSSNEKLLQFLTHVNTLKKKFYPNIFLLSGRKQTIHSISSREDSVKMPYSKREIFKLSDGGEIALDYIDPENQSQSSKRLIVILFPGITSGSQTSYIKSYVKSALKAGANVIVFNSRGLGGIKLKTPKLFSATNYEDVREVLNYVRSKYPNDKILGLGASLGGMILCQYLISEPEESKRNLDMALVISITMDAMSGTKSLNKLHPDISGDMAKSLVYIVNKNREVLEKSNKWDISQVLSSKIMTEFDNSFMKIQAGFSNLNDYYEQANLKGKISKISIPVVAFTALDDPMQVGKDLPISEACQPNSNLALIVTDRGGHLGFLEGFFNQNKSFHYSDKFIHDFILAYRLYELEFLSKSKL